MGREIMNVQTEKKSNGFANIESLTNDRIHNAPKVSDNSVEVNDYEIKECTEKCSPQKPDVLSVKSTNFEDGLHEMKDEKPGSQKSSPAVPKSASVAKDRPNHTVPQPFSLATEKLASGILGSPVSSESAGGVNSTANAHTVHYPDASKSSQPNSPEGSTATMQANNVKHAYDDDTWSLASSTAASVRTNKSRITVGSAPKFRCYERAEKRKEFYTKLEQKHQALEAEKTQCQQRQKEERDAAIKQLRKNMVYKANPVPSFYYEPPPPKPEPKKLPLTRPKSPKFNVSRRKSLSDAVNSAQEEKGKSGIRAQRHSFGGAKTESSPSGNAKIRSQAGRRSSNGSLKARERGKQERETPDTVASNRTEQTNGDIAVQS